MKMLPAIALAAFALSTNVSANLVTNGGFETFTGAFRSDGGAQLFSSSTGLTGWTVGARQEVALLETPNIYNLSASGGVNFLDLAGYSNNGFPKGVTQTITGFSVGDTYTLSMDVGIRNGPCVSGGNNCHGPVQASAGIGSTSQTFTEDSSAAGNVWGTFGFDFVATSTTMDLSLQGISLPLGNAFIGVDNVSIVPATVPVPAAIWLLGPAMAGLGFARRNR